MVSSVSELPFAPGSRSRAKRPEAIVRASSSTSTLKVSRSLFSDRSSLEFIGPRLSNLIALYELLQFFAEFFQVVRRRFQLPRAVNALTARVSNAVHGRGNLIDAH